ncbi:5-methylcytosine restriction system specificity protein McrC, partial [Escherichia coli]
YDKWRVDAQVSSKNLISYNGKALFKLRPDICLRPRKSTTGSVITCDVKWKIVNGRKDSLEQSQADLYQMLAYGLNYQEGEGDMIL